MKKNYITAILTLIAQGSDIQEILTGVRNTMEEKGHMRLYPSVLRGVVRILETKSYTAGVTLTIARESDLTLYAAQIKHALSHFPQTGTHNTHIDPSIIGGFIADNRKTVIDHSFKKALTNLYRSVTN